VLEVGFGNGMLLEFFLRAGARSVSGIDWSPMAMEAARLRLLTTGYGHAAQLTCADICQGLPTSQQGRRGGVQEQGGTSSGQSGGGSNDGAHVDLVAALDSAAYWPDLSAGLAACNKALRPGGRLLLGLRGSRLADLAPLEKVRALLAAQTAAADDPVEGDPRDGGAQLRRRSSVVPDPPPREAGTKALLEWFEIHGKAFYVELHATSDAALLGEAAQASLVTAKDAAVLAAVRDAGFAPEPDPAAGKGAAEPTAVDGGVVNDECQWATPFASVPGELGMDLYLFQKVN
jgi:SAM-dependent methyltransferase